RFVDLPAQTADEARALRRFQNNVQRPGIVVLVVLICSANHGRSRRVNENGARRAAAPTDHSIAFGPFRLTPSRQLLVDGDEPMHLGSRALHLLTALIDRAGDVAIKPRFTAAKKGRDKAVSEHDAKKQ